MRKAVAAIPAISRLASVLHPAMRRVSVTLGQRRRTTSAGSGAQLDVLAQRARRSADDDVINDGNIGRVSLERGWEVREVQPGLLSGAACDENPNVAAFPSHWERKSFGWRPHESFRAGDEV